MEDLALRVRRKDAGMQMREAQCWFVLFLIKHIRVGKRSDIYVFLTLSDTVGKNGQVCGHESFGDVAFFYQMVE